MVSPLGVPTSSDVSVKIRKSLRSRHIIASWRPCAHLSHNLYLTTFRESGVSRKAYCSPLFLFWNLLSSIYLPIQNFWGASLLLYFICFVAYVSFSLLLTFTCAVSVFYIVHASLLLISPYMLFFFRYQTKT